MNEETWYEFCCLVPYSRRIYSVMCRLESVVEMLHWYTEYDMRIRHVTAISISYVLNALGTHKG